MLLDCKQRHQRAVNRNALAATSNLSHGDRITGGWCHEGSRIVTTIYVINKGGPLVVLSPFSSLLCMNASPVGNATSLPERSRAPASVSHGSLAGTTRPNTAAVVVARSPAGVTPSSQDALLVLPLLATQTGSAMGRKGPGS